jgi:hypothetical protein
MLRAFRFSRHADSDRSRRPAALVVLLVATLVVLWPASQVRAQPREDDRAWYQRFIDGVAAIVYGAAWPTATYRRVAIGDIDVSGNSAIVTFRLHGKSAFADGDLWVDVKLGLRSTGEVTSIQWGNYNGFFPPGFTWRTLGEVAQEVNRRNGVAATRTPTPTAPFPPPLPPPPPPIIDVSAVCLSNPTPHAFNYALKWGGKTENLSLRAGEVWRFWAPASAGDFDITFDDDLTDARHETTYTLGGFVMRGEPSSCTDSMTIQFVVSQSRIAVEPKMWAPGSSHPFASHVVASATNGVWVCAEGFKWANAEDKNSLECVDARLGFVGVVLQRDAGQAFVRVTQVLPGSSAAEAGVVSGMYIVSVDGVSTEGLEMPAVMARIRGDMGTTVRLGLAGASAAPQVVTLTRR